METSGGRGISGGTGPRQGTGAEPGFASVGQRPFRHRQCFAASGWHRFSRHPPATWSLPWSAPSHLIRLY